MQLYRCSSVPFYTRQPQPPPLNRLLQVFPYPYLLLAVMKPLVFTTTPTTPIFHPYSSSLNSSSTQTPTPHPTTTPSTPILTQAVRTTTTPTPTPQFTQIPPLTTTILYYPTLPLPSPTPSFFPNPTNILP